MKQKIGSRKYHGNLRWRLAAGVCGMLLAVPAAVAAPLIKLGTLVPERTTYHNSMMEMRDQWRKAPGGGADLRIYAGGILGGEAKMVSLMRQGVLDAGLLTAVGLGELEPGVEGMQSLPMMFRSLAEVDYVGEQLQPMMEKRLEAKGFVVLFWSDAGWVRYFSKQPLIEPEDLKRMKIFVWAGDAKVADIYKSAGYTPVPLETSDIVPMLDTGMINVVAMPPIAALAAQVHSRAPHMLELNWAPLIGALVLRKAVWDKLPAETRAAMRQAAAVAGAQNKKLGREESEHAVAAMQARGLTVHPVSPALDARWRQTAEQFYPRIKGDIVPADIFDEVQRILKTYRSAGGAQP